MKQSIGLLDVRGLGCQCFIRLCSCPFCCMRCSMPRGLERPSIKHQHLGAASHTFCYHKSLLSTHISDSFHQCSALAPVTRSLAYLACQLPAYAATSGGAGQPGGGGRAVPRAARGRHRQRGRTRRRLRSRASAPECQARPLPCTVLVDFIGVQAAPAQRRVRA